VEVAIVELDGHDRRVLARRHPEIKGHGTTIVIAASTAAGRQLLPLLDTIVNAVNAAERIQIDRLVDSIMPAGEVPSMRQLEEARREAQTRRRILRDYGAYTGPELADLAGSSAGNRSATAYRWKREGLVFAVATGGAEVFPKFQFGPDGRPLPVVSSVLTELERWPTWDVAQWFVMANGSLDRRAPVDVMVDRPDAVARAARYDSRRPLADVRPS
jgi:hypothetical protein